MTKRTDLTLSLVLGLVLGAGLLLASAPNAQLQLAPSTAPAQASPLVGQTTTLLADGRLLVLGGVAGKEPGDAAIIKDGRTSNEVKLTVGLNRARAWHTATLLPDGTVLILGGLGPGGSPVDAAELFDPETGNFTVLPATGLSSRAHHTTTVLTDGQVLIAGGVSASGQPATEAELYDFVTQTAFSLQDLPQINRKDHTATLMPDGRVLLEGGTTATGEAPDFVEIFDPEARGLSVASRALAPDLEGSSPSLEESLPENGASDVAPDLMMSVRFSKPLNVETVTSNSINLEGPSGPVPAKVVPVENGRLAFMRPAGALLPSTGYTIRLNGLVDRSGAAVASTEVHFTTGSSLTDDEDWIPNARNLSGDWRSNRPDSRWRLLPPLQAPRGVTALAGQALTLNGQPLANVTIGIDGVRVRTDRTGRFLLSPLSSGHHELLIDGRSANKPRKTYGVFEAGVNIIEAVTTPLSYTIWMPRIDTLHTVTIPSPTTGEVVATTPLIPGLELHIPPQTVISDIDGKPVTQVSITPIPLDRTPFPLPDGVYVPIYFTIQPGGAYVQTWTYSGARGARLVYPNYRNEPVGKKASFWHYDPEDKGWYVYGQGTVIPTGKQVVPDPGVAIYEFTGAMISSLGNPPGSWAAFMGWLFGGDPVDLGSGLFILNKTDLYLPDTIPISLSRTYRPGDSAVRTFGKGSTHFYEMFLWSVNNYQDADLVLPDGARIHYVRISSGTGFTDAVYEHTATPSEFYKSRISWNGNGWDLKLKDGTVFVFGDLAPLQSIRDRYGNTVSITRTNGQTGNITQITSPNGRWIQFTSDGSNRITQAKDNIGRTVAYSYDGNGRLSTVTDTKGGVTTYTYDGSDRMLTIRDARNIVFLTNEYDTNSRVTKQTQADGTTFNFSYTLDPNGKVTATEVTDPSGYVRRATFNSTGYGLTDTYGYGTQQQQAYTFTLQSGSNFITDLTDALARVTHIAYDSMGNATSFTQMYGTGSAATSSATYESTYNQVTSITDPLSHTWTFGRDSSASLTSVTDPLSNQTAITYNASGQVLTIQDPLNNVTQLSYDLGDLVGITDPLTNTVGAFRDAAGRVISSSDGLGRVTRYEYDAQNLFTRITDSLGGQTSFTYDANGNLLTVTDARSNVTTYTYNSMDRLVTRQDPLTRTETYEYDANGNTTKVTDRRGKVTTFTYDPLNRQTFAGYGTVAGTPPTYESTITRTYDGANRPATFTDSLTGAVTFSFDNLDNISSQVTPNGTVNYAHDVAGRRTSMTVVGQTQVTYGYDNADQLTSITQGSSVASIAYDAASRRSVVTLPNGITQTYGYDNASRLTGITYALGQTTLGALSYTLDPAYRRTALSGSYARTSLPAAVASASYDAANEVTSWAGATLTYDSNGDLTTDGANTYTWDARTHLASISGGATASFQYDAPGRRSRRVVNGTTTDFLYDGLNPVQELSAGSPTANLITGLGTDEYFLRTDSAGARSLLRDALGSTVALADSAGSVQTQYTYEPFGKAVSTGQASSSSFQFTGRESDGTGLLFYRARYYSPTLQRFVAEDPLQLKADLVSRYGYVGESPANATDPLGEYAVWDDVAFTVGGAVAGVGAQGLGDLVSGNLSSWQSYAAAAAGGAAGGEALLYGGPVASGATGGFVSNLVQQGLNWGPQSQFDGWGLVQSTAVGAAAGAIPGLKWEGVNSGRNSYNAIYKQMVTKFRNGSIGSLSPWTAWMMFAGRAWDTGMPFGTTFGGLAAGLFGPHNGSPNSAAGRK